MKLKLDENFGHRAAAFLREAGHDVDAVLQEGLGGASDREVFNACLSERRCLVTLDVDFANVLRFPPHQSAGIAVLRSTKSNAADMQALLIGNLAKVLQSETIDSRLWIVEATGVRVHADTDPQPGSNKSISGEE